MKDFFYYNKTDRRLLLGAFGLLFVVLVLRFAKPSPGRVEKDRELAAYEQEMARQDSLKRSGYGRYKHQGYGRYRGDGYAGGTSASRKAPFTLDALRLSPFDPNQADSAQLAGMGLPVPVIHSIIHYREKGGTYRTAESVQRLYGMSDSLFARLRPYLQFPAAGGSSASSFASSSVSRTAADTVRRVAYVPMEKYPAGTCIDLNTADTTELKKIPGIGSSTARAIVTYRERLGGFYAVEQLAEVRLATPEMQQWFKVEHPTLRILRVNHDKLNRLMAHPYLTYSQARDIIAEREARGDIKSLSRLSTYKEFTEKDFERLLPYLDFN
jgi:competence ComEA-like helix-hairpin-helix protein